MEPVDRAAAFGGQLVAAVGEQPQDGAVVVGSHGREVVAVLGDDRDAAGVDAVALAPMAALEHAGAGGQRRWNIDDALAGGDEPLGQQPAEASGAFNRPASLRPARGPCAQRRQCRVVGRHAQLAEQRWHELGPPPLSARHSRDGGNAGAVKEAPMAILAGFDVHRAQITFDALDTETGEVMRGRIDATPAAVTRWTERFQGAAIEVAVEACTGWLFVCDALVAAGAVAHLAEPVETRALRGRKRRAKTDREDARWLRGLLADGRLPEAWIPPEHVRQWRSRARLRHTLIDERTQSMQRIQATLFHHGVGGTPEKLRTRAGRAFLDRPALPEDARERIEIALAMVDAIDARITPLERELRQLARRQPGCRAPMAHYGIGPLTATAILAELGDCRRFGSSTRAVRYSGLDITVAETDDKRAPGHLSRQGPPTLRWALFEAA